MPRLPRLFLLFWVTLWLSPSAVASSYPTAAESALGEISFADAPLALPVTQSFITAMLDVATDIKKQCSTTEAFGWPMQQTEQERVNMIFNAAVSAFGKQGFSMTPQNSRATTRDITVFTAKKSAKELLVLWSAGETGLILLICQTEDSATASPASTNTNAPPSPAVSQASATAKKIKPPAKAAPKSAPKSAAKQRAQEKAKPKKPATSIAAPSPTDESAASNTAATTPPTPQDENIPDLPPVPQDAASASVPAPPATPRSTLAEPPMTPEIKALLEAMPAAPSPPTPPPTEPVVPAPQGPMALP